MSRRMGASGAAGTYPAPPRRTRPVATFGSAELRVHRTRFSQLGFVRLEPRVWRFVDLTEGQTDPPRCVGPIYASRAELLADLTEYARTSWGLQ